jgi:hypothetical protein
MKDDTGRVYNQAVSDYEDRTFLPQMIAGIIVSGANTGKAVETLTESALANVKGGDITAIGRAFQKHAVREETVFVGEITGNVAMNTEQGMEYLNKILSDPNVMSTIIDTNAYGKVLDVRLPDGMGARWSADGKTFIDFLERYTLQ